MRLSCESSAACCCGNVTTVQGDWAEAADLVLRPRGGEKEEATAARKAYMASGDAAAMLRVFPAWMHVERSLLEGYRSCGPKAHANALQRVPRNMRLMYVHAYQVPCRRRHGTVTARVPLPILA